MNLETIEKILPRLRHGTTASKILNWLGKFNKEDRYKLFNLLKVFEYISYSELLYRFDLLFYEILKDIKKEDKILVILYGKLGKSSTFMSYPFTHTEAYKGFTKDGRGNHIVIESDYKKIVEYTPEHFKHIVFLDDFIGSGRTFDKECNKSIPNGKFGCLKGWFDNFSDFNIMILASLTMNDGGDFIRVRFSNIRIFTDYRDKIFDVMNSPLKIYSTNIQVIKDFVENYTKSEYNLGYGKSESVVTFFYGSPNNTLGVFWDKHVLFPRHTKDKIQEVSDLRKEISFYTTFFEDYNFTSDKNDKIYSDFLTKKPNLVYILFAYLLLKKDKHEDIMICHLLSISNGELDKVITYCIEVEFIRNEDRSLLNKGLHWIDKMTKKSSSTNFKSPTKNNLKIEKQGTFIPSQIKGKV